MEQDKRPNYSFVNILNITASIASLAAFMMMMAGALNDQFIWRTFIKYITYALWISGTCSIIVCALWKIILIMRKQKKVSSWCIFPIFCLIALFLIITFIQVGKIVSDFFILWTFGNV